MLFLSIGIAFGFIYWLHEESIVVSIPRIVAVVCKWISICLLILYLLHWHTFIAPIKWVVFKVGTLFFYGIGDVIIAWNQHISVVFFMIGHLFFLSLQTIYHHNAWSILRETIIIGSIMVFSISITLASSYLFKLRHPHMCLHLKVLYAIYILSLSMLLAIPLIVDRYIGSVLFIISDICIGFQIHQMRKLTFPLYYGSLLYFIYWSVQRV